MMPVDLYNKCYVFEKLAETDNYRSIKNLYTFLNKISSLKNFEDRIKLASKHFEKIGDGSARTVFALPEDKVIKIAKNDKGTAQNLEESKPELHTSITSRVIAADVEGAWVICHFAKDITHSRFQKLTGIDFDDLADALYYKFNNESDEFEKPKTYESIIKTKIFNDLANLIYADDLIIGDIARIESWGEDDERPVLVDFGLNKETYKDLYQ